VRKAQHHLEAKGAGHYGIFSGRRWRDMVYPHVKSFILAHSKADITDAGVAIAAKPKAVTKKATPVAKKAAPVVKKAAPAVAKATPAAKKATVKPVAKKAPATQK
jgi:poly(3-hydroxybutyrate) depolymerase